jgi:hypothetical protein
LSALGNPGVESQVIDLRKTSVKLNKSWNLEGMRSMMNE